MIKFMLTTLVVWNSLLGFFQDADHHHFAVGFMATTTSSSSRSSLSLSSLSLSSSSSSEESSGKSSSSPLLTRRGAMVTSGVAALLPWISSSFPLIANAVESTPYELRDRKGNKGAIIAEDYWYMTNKLPPRKLDAPLVLDDPQWNVFGSCETTAEGGGSNSCTYVSLKQRIPAYSKYAFNIGLGAKEYQSLGKILQDAAKTNNERAWNAALPYVTTIPSSPPPPSIDAVLKMVLFASAMLTSPNYSGPTREILVARFYVNEVGFAIKEIAAAIEERDAVRALDAWTFGKDNWNSYYQVVNPKITAKVGDKFEAIP